MAQLLHRGTVPPPVVWRETLADAIAVADHVAGDTDETWFVVTDYDATEGAPAFAAIRDSEQHGGAVLLGRYEELYSTADPR